LWCLLEEFGGAAGLVRREDFHLGEDVE
jgi:hypothetical protein